MANHKLMAEALVIGEGSFDFSKTGEDDVKDRILEALMRDQDQLPCPSGSSSSRWVARTPDFSF